MAARLLHEVRDTRDAQPVPEFPVEKWIDSLTGRRLRRQFLGSCSGGVLIGGIARRSAVDVYFRRTQGNASNPRPGEIDLVLGKFIEPCWRQQLR